MSSERIPPLADDVAEIVRFYQNSRKAAAAILRLIADEVVPEEDEVADGFGVLAQNERERIRQRLLAEAERAEAGR